MQSKVSQSFQTHPYRENGDTQPYRMGGCEASAVRTRTALLANWTFTCIQRLQGGGFGMLILGAISRTSAGPL